MAKNTMKPKKPIATKVPVKHTTKPAPAKAPAEQGKPDLPGPHGRSPVCTCTRGTATGQPHQHNDDGSLTYVSVTASDRGY